MSLFLRITCPSNFADFMHALYVVAHMTWPQGHQALATVLKVEAMFN